MTDAVRPTPKKRGGKRIKGTGFKATGLSRRTGKPPLRGEALLQHNREAAQLAGRPGGYGNELPLGAIKALRTANFRVKKDLPANVAQDASEVAGLALERTVQVLMGRVHSRRAASVLKAAIALREEICEPVVKETKLSGAMTMAQIVSAAAIPAKPPALPAGAPEKVVVPDGTAT